ncbi:hypothetical protein X941_5090 [Burkholderia pseudomallei MSHR5569]|nr:hypothetical protein X941_5090 [Burkholderia pseudomallei MSHR5569]
MLKVSDEFASVHDVTTLLGPHWPSSVTLTCALLIVSCVALSAWPVHGFVPLALPLMRPHRLLVPVNVVDVMLTMPAGVIVPLNVATQFALIEPLDSVVSKGAEVAENGSPFGFIGCPSTRTTVTASAGVAAAAANANATTNGTNLRLRMGLPHLTNGGLPPVA